LAAALPAMHLSARSSPTYFSKLLRNNEFTVATICQKLAVKLHQPLNEPSKFASPPSAQLVRKIGLVPKEDTPCSHLLLQKRVDVTASAESSGQLG
jgi:hypothetical protein